MKRFLIVLVLVFVLGTTVAMACPPAPEKPVCPDGQITLEEAEWVDAVTHQECRRMGWVRYGFFDWRYECVKWQTVVDVPGHWTDPVCYIPCSETYAGEKVFTEYEPAGDAMWNDWVDLGDDVLYRTGSQLYERTWTQTFYDIHTEEVCLVNDGSQKVGRLLAEKEDVPCIGMYLLPGAGEYDYPCYLNRNPETDSALELPVRFGGDGWTDYAQGLCNQKWTCDGWVEDVFNWSGDWEFVCDFEPCLDCE